MKPISHRGNLNGKIPERENTIDYIDEALAAGYDVEIDVHYKDDRLWLGHDGPDGHLPAKWIADNASRLWIHCKDLESISFLRYFGSSLNYFGHNEDPFVLTSQGYFFCLPSDDLNENCVLVMPEYFNFTPKPSNKAFAVLTDYPTNYKGN